MDLSKRRRKRKVFCNPVAVVSIVLSIACLLVIAMSVLRLPEISTTSIKIKSFRSRKADMELGKFGKMIVEMLPRDLAFTVFVPSEKAIERDLKLSTEANRSSADDDNLYATLSRVLGFSAVPRKIYSSSVSAGEELRFDSVSGFRLFVSKGVGDRVLAVNRVKAERVDLIEGETVVHIMDGVLMDADFEQSVEPDEED